MNELEKLFSKLYIQHNHALQKIDIHKLFHNFIKNNETKCQWTLILKNINFIPHIDYVIDSNTMKQQKKYWKGDLKKQFEPRLLCKIDSEEKKPEIFKLLNLNIISIKNGVYLLTTSSIYFELTYTNTEIIYLNKDNDSILLNFGNSETSLLDNLKYSNIFETKDYLNEPIKYGSLLGGRHYCSFLTILNGKKIKIEGSQFETDGCYESENKILIAEVKNGIQIKNFNIRQLYYPYRYIYDRLKGKNIKKQIICLFIFKDKKDIIHIFNLRWKHPKIMDSIYQESYSKYKFNT
jgi:hypothetical protein